MIDRKWLKPVLRCIKCSDKLDMANDEDFHTFFDMAMDLLSMTYADVAKEFDISKSTVGRWKNRKSTPCGLMKDVVYDRLMTKLWWEI